MHTPLTPFTVVFCHIIANHNSSQQDLKLLDDFLDSLRPAAGLSEGVEKFLSLCSVFVKVAKAYVRAKAQEEISYSQSADMQFSQPQPMQPVLGQFDGYLSALGFAPHNTADQIDLDWYNGNVNLLNMMEQDINDPNDPMWDYNYMPGPQQS